MARRSRKKREPQTRYGRMLDEALAVGKEELRQLMRGKVDEAQRLAFTRGGILERAVAGVPEETLDSVGDKLIALKELHDKIVDEAKSLQLHVRKDLTNLKKQTKRLAGYSIGSGNVPLKAKQRFVDKRG